ncbi:acylphosphatase [Shouchella shacheensis]|uniref:acylphosphatase n=1 Tax=Shouchella shacheensis TaxID=1649580 RepID=UPI000740003B|nr:acylphosphatase [Shouchella shacheensis]
MKRVKAEVTGHVQGVGFRAFVQEEALEYAVQGTVQNTANDSVLIHVQGDSDRVDHFLKAVVKGNRFSKVAEIMQKEEPVQEGESTFRIV